ncbi:MAG TPA: cytochrome c biogenesis protein CcsA [Opitutaceae bacterium]|nr:cytochrome c biogenesis protein CcsA [Opitutaceae bacterium]
MFAGMIDRSWLWLAAECYLAGLLLGTYTLVRGGRQAGGWINLIITAGYVFQVIGLYLRGHAVGGCPLGNTFEIFQFTAWSAITLYLVVGVTFRLSLLGYFTACLASVLTLVSLSLPAWDATRRAHIFGGNMWIEFHAALALFSYGTFALLALTSAMFLLRNYSLKTKNLGGAFAFLPSITELDHISVRLLTTGVTLMTCAVVVGANYWLRDPGRASLVKVMITVSIWFAYAFALFLRRRGVLLAKRFGWVCVGLFGAALISLWVIDSHRHPAADQAPAAEQAPK